MLTRICRFNAKTDCRNARSPAQHRLLQYFHAPALRDAARARCFLAAAFDAATPAFSRVSELIDDAIADLRCACHAPRNASQHRSCFFQMHHEARDAIFRHSLTLRAGHGRLLSAAPRQLSRAQRHTTPANKPSLLIFAMPISG